MKKILNELSQKIGARGCMVVTRDGIAIASAGRDESHDDRIAALAQKTIREALSAIERANLSVFDRMVLTADAGRIILIELSVAFLVVITDLDVITEHVMLEIESAAHRIERASRIEI